MKEMLETHLRTGAEATILVTKASRGGGGGAGKGMRKQAVNPSCMVAEPFLHGGGRPIPLRLICSSCSLCPQLVLQVRRGVVRCHIIP